MTSYEVAKYKGHEIDFSHDMVNLTQMWRACGKVHHKKPNYWLKTDSTKELIEALQDVLKVRISGFLQTKRGAKGGTFAHWQLAIAYAQFLSSRFQLFCGALVRNRFEEIGDPELGITCDEIRERKAWVASGKSEPWIEGRMNL
jgi:KilA-N domain